MQLKNVSFSGERMKDVKGMQKRTEALLVSRVPSAFLLRRIASASTGKKKAYFINKFSVYGTSKAFSFCASLILEVLPQLLNAKLLIAL